MEDQPNEKWKELNETYIFNKKEQSKMVNVENNPNMAIMSVGSMEDFGRDPNEGQEDTQHHADGRVVRGIVRMGKIPKGEIEYPNGDVYDGEIKNHKAHGLGKMNYSSGDRFTGRFLNDERSGVGTMETPSGVYTGSFKNDQFHGKGVFQFNNGGVYNGKIFQHFFFKI